MLLFCASFAFAQSWVGNHTNLQTGHFATENSRPNPASFYDMMGFCGGTNWDSNSDPNPAKDVVRNARSFHLMEIDYRYQKNPSNYDVVPCTTDCDDWSCFPQSGCDLPTPESGKSSFAYYKTRYCGKWKTNFDTIYASLEAITPYYKNGECPGNGYEWRGWPHKWYNAEEWGGDEASIRQNAKKYAAAFVTTFCPDDESRECVVNVLEVGNEPWGDPGIPAFHAIQRGVIDAMKEHYGSDDPADWRMKLSTAAFQADDPNSSINDYVDYMIPEDVRPYYTYISIHPYAFHITGDRITETPEAAEGEFLRFKNLEEWRRIHMPQAMLNVTEFGWNSKDLGNNFPGVGEVAQSVYTLRAILLMSRYRVNKAFIYELFDQPGVTLFNSTGLIGRNNTPVKKGFQALTRFQESYGDKVFLKALHEDLDPENGMIAYVLGNKNGQPTHLVAWRPNNINNITDYPSDYIEKNIILPSGNMQFDANGQYKCLGWNDAADGYISSQTNVQINGSLPHQAKIRLTAMPIVIPLVVDGVRYNSNGELEDYDGDCSSYVGGGQIGGQEESCTPFDPLKIYDSGSTIVSGLNLNYQWEESPNATSGSWTIIEGANGQELDPAYIETTTYFRRGRQLENCDIIHYSNVISKRVELEACDEEDEQEEEEEPEPDESPLTMNCISGFSLTANENGIAQAIWQEPNVNSSCISTEVANCEVETLEGFTYLGSFGNSEYYVSTQKMKWIEAKAASDAVQAQLVKIDDELENEFVQEVLQLQGISTAFIGLSDENNDGQFAWIDESTPTYANWNSSNIAPNGQTDYAYLGNWSNAPWYKAGQWTAKHFVCERVCQNSGDEEEEDEISMVQTQGPENGSWLEPGIYTVAYEAVNSCGDVANCSFEIIVETTGINTCKEEEIADFIQLGSLNNHQYQLSETKDRWINALQDCEDQGGYLTIVDSQEENEFLHEALTLQSVSTAYIGLSDIVGDGSFLWSDGQTPAYTNWSHPPAMNQQTDYIYLGAWSDGPWYAGSEYTEKYYVCEFDCQELPDVQGLQVGADTRNGTQVFPNPVSDVVQLRQTAEGFHRLLLTDVSGRVLAQQQFTDRIYEHQLDMSQLQEGLYFLTIESEASGIETFKLVKR